MIDMIDLLYVLKWSVYFCISLCKYQKEFGFLVLCKWNTQQMCYITCSAFYVSYTDQSEFMKVYNV